MSILLSRLAASESGVDSGNGAAAGGRFGARLLTEWRGELWQRIVARAPLPLWYFSVAEEGRFGILMYHRTAPRSLWRGRPTFNVTPERLRTQLEGLLERGYQPWSLREVLATLDAGRRIPPRVFVVTFDDGHVSNYLYAWPILKDLHVPATVFVATAYLDSAKRFPFDNWNLAGCRGVPFDSWGPLTTAQCEEMLAGGRIDLGTHTHTHRDFRGRPADLEFDIRLSLDLLERRFGIQNAPFAFPFGRRSSGHAADDLVNAARRTGVACALTTESELAGPDRDRFDWGRFTVQQADNSETLAAKIDGCHTRMRDLGRRLLSPFADRVAQRQSDGGGFLDLARLLDLEEVRQ